MMWWISAMTLVVLASGERDEATRKNAEITMKAELLANEVTRLSKEKDDAEKAIDLVQETDAHQHEAKERGSLSERDERKKKSIAAGTAKRSLETGLPTDAHAKAEVPPQLAQLSEKLSGAKSFSGASGKAKKMKREVHHGVKSVDKEKEKKENLLLKMKSRMSSSSRGTRESERHKMGNSADTRKNWDVQKVLQQEGWYSTEQSCDQAASKIWNTLLPQNVVDDLQSAVDYGGSLDPNNMPSTDGIFLLVLRLLDSTAVTEKSYQKTEDFEAWTDEDDFPEAVSIMTIKDMKGDRICDVNPYEAKEKQDWIGVQCYDGGDETFMMNYAQFRAFMEQMGQNSFVVEYEETDHGYDHFFVVVNQDGQSLLVQAIGVNEGRYEIHKTTEDWFEANDWQDAESFNRWVDASELWGLFQEGRVPGVEAGSRPGVVTVLNQADLPEDLSNL